MKKPSKFFKLYSRKLNPEDEKNIYILGCVLSCKIIDKRLSLTAPFPPSPCHQESNDYINSNNLLIFRLFS